MGDKYIKTEDGKEVVYERGLLIDTKIGELHDAGIFSGGAKETRNLFGENVRVERPGIFSNDREGTVGDQKGTFHKGFFDNAPTFRPDESSDSSSHRSSGRSHSYIGGGGGGSGASAGTDSSSPGLAGLVGIVLGIYLTVAAGGAIFRTIFRDSDKANSSRTRQAYTQIHVDQYHGNSLEENTDLLLQDIRGRIKNFDEFSIIAPRKIHRPGDSGNENEYGMAYIGPKPRMMRVFYTSDNGKNWDEKEMPTDPFFRSLWDGDFSNNNHEKWRESAMRSLEGHNAIVEQQIKDFEANRQLLKNRISAEENVRRMFRYVEKNYELGDLNKYQITLAPRMILKEDREIALYNDSAFYVFHSTDNGMTWTPRPPTDPFLIRVSENHERRMQKIEE